MLLCVLLLVACSNKVVLPEGASLNIAIVGEIPNVHNDKIQFESFSMEEISQDLSKISQNYDAVMITSTVFEEASDDKYIDMYKSLKIPTIFFDSSKRHFPFLTTNITYSSSSSSLDNGSHSTIYLYDANNDEENTWYFHLNKDKNINILYSDLFQKSMNYRKFLLC